MISNAWALIWSYFEVPISIIKEHRVIHHVAVKGLENERSVHIHGDSMQKLPLLHGYHTFSNSRHIYLTKNQ